MQIIGLAKAGFFLFFTAAFKAIHFVLYSFHATPCSLGNAEVGPGELTFASWVA